MIMSDKEQRWLASLIKVTDILKKCNIEFFLDTGTLLGAVREKKFISWDGDIDLGVVVDKHRPDQFDKFVDEAYGSGYNVNYSNSGVGLLKAIDIEINIGFYKEAGRTYQCEFSKYECRHPFILFLRNVKTGVHKNSRGHNVKFFIKRILINNKYLLNILSKDYLEKHVAEEIKLIVVDKQYFDSIIELGFYGQRFPVPKNYEAYLEQRYGKNWRIPVPDYNYFTDDNALTF